jgi:fructokinase
MTFDPNQPPLVFGEVLFDRFPDGRQVLGGAPFNVAWHLQAFGAAPRFVSAIGDDPLGEEIAAAMDGWGMDRAGLQRDPAHPTGTVDVSLEGGEPSYEIVADRAYDNIDADALPALSPGTLLYHGSLALRAEPSREAFDRLCEQQAVAVFLDVNLRDPWWDEARLKRLLDRTTWVKLNADELRLLAPQGTVSGDASVESQARALQQHYGLDIVYATLGAQGALAIDASGKATPVAPGGRVDVVDAVGAGDGFASVLILGLLRGWPLSQTLERAQAFASAIVGQRGATVHDPAFYAGFRADWGL